MKIILSTRNQSKATQIKALFTNIDVEILTLDEAGIEGEAEEDGTTLAENAHKKAIFANISTDGQFWTLADDTGLFINALDGRPGINAARWAGKNASTKHIMYHCLDMLKFANDRSAYFETCAVLISPDCEVFEFSGRVDGHLLDSPKVEPQPSMPYSSLFVPVGHEKCWAEMTTEEENAISHRGKAFRQVADFLNQYKG